MARAGPSRLPRQQSKDHNAKQALARRERKAGAGNADNGPSSIHDVFEFVTNQEEAKQSGSTSRSNKRESRALNRATKNDAGDQEGPKLGKSRHNDDEDDDEEDGGDRFEQTLPVWDRDAGVRSEDDEEIDSDEAFGESDEEKFEGWKFGGDRKHKGAKVREEEGEESSQDEESSEAEEDDDDDDLMDISKLLDGGESGEEESSINSDEEEEEEDDSDDQRLEQRMQSISGKSGTKRPAEVLDEGTTKGAKRRVLKERTEAVPEGEWNAPSGRSGASLLTIDDLMEPLKEQGGTSYTSLRDTAKILKPKRSDRAVAASKRGGGALQAPLPSIVQDRLDRSAAYDETKAEVQGWQPTIKRIREAEHLSFPLQPDPVIKPSTALMTSQFKPTNSFERDIASMLEREGMSDKRLAEAEELRMNEKGMSAEEIQERRSELRKMRELLFREEQKAKRVSKIKSKTYRKIARKQREREVAKAKEAGLAIGDEEDEDEDENEKAARLRAKERATLKHKNTGKWAQNIIGLHGANHLTEARNAIEEQLRKGEQLRRRIQGKDSDEGEGEEGSEEDEDSEGEGEGDNVFDELRALEKRNEQERASDEADMQGKKGVWGMQFMKNARDRNSEQTQDEVEDLQREMEELEGEDESEDEDEMDRKLLQGGANPGRRVFTSSAAAIVDPRDETQEQVRKTSAAKEHPTSKSILVKDTRASLPNDEALEAEENPWLAAKSNTKLSRKKNESTVSKEGSAQSKAANRIEKHIAKGDQERREAMEDAQLDIDPEARLNLRKTEVKTKKGRQARVEEEEEEEDSDEDGSLADEPVIVKGKGPAAIQQRDLVAEAFAGDDVTNDFAAEKNAIMQAEAPQVIDTTLPGWGAWGGKGVRRPNKKKAEELKKKLTKVIPGLDPTKRKDASMVNVIINQKKDKKAEKYLGKDVPFPYTSRAQYEMAMRNPLGPEWNTRTQHQKLTLPKVVTKPGKAIKPIERLF